LSLEWKKRQNPEAHFVQAVVDSNTGLHLSEPLDPSKQLAETAAMDVDPIAASDAPTGGEDIHLGDDDLDLEDEDLLDLE
jgi:NAD(P)H-hydrate repair Nnr-like enzyme with NAD(P)H-hydrate epimerase domain